MWPRLHLEDVLVITHYVGVLLIGIGASMAVPLAVAVTLGEWGPALDYLAGAGVACAAGAAMMHAKPTKLVVTHSQALAITALSWVAASLAASVPLALSGHYISFLDAVFDALSGLTTTGLTLVTDLDHMAHSHNMWRHLTQLIGGQGIVVAALSLAVGLRSGAFSLYVAEGRDERILPNVLHTARFIWFVTVVYIGLGTLMLLGVNSYLGMDTVRAGLHAFWASIATYDTGGFAPQSMNAAYYHSVLFEAGTMFLMVAGFLNFSLHAQVWRGDRAELWRSLEVRTLVVSVFGLSILAAIGLSASRLFNTPLSVIRTGMYHVVSAQSAGHQTFYPEQWTLDVSTTTFFAVMLAMAFGGAVSSTAGGIKALRLGLTLKAIGQAVRSAVFPRSAAVVTRYYHLGKKILTPEIASAVTLTFALYVTVYVAGGLVGAAYGYYAPAALFESISATANSGPSTGITAPDMPLGLKLVYMFQMWAGRLEFIAVLAIVMQIAASAAAVLKKK